MDRFSKYNPKVNLLFFLLIIIQSLMLFNPIMLLVSLLGAFCYKLILKGSQAFRYFFLYTFPIVIFIALFNMLFAHYGEHILFTIRNLPFTAEAFLYGLTQGLTVGCVMLWFSSYNDIVSGEMLLSVFGSALPNTSMIFSMTLTFIPRLKRNAAEIKDSKALLSNKNSSMSRSVDNLSTLVMMTLEDSIEVSDSMRARGFTGKRTQYSRYKFRYTDLLFLIAEILFFAIILVLKMKGDAAFEISHEIRVGMISPLLIISYISMSFLPVIVDVLEDVKWKYLKQKA